ncbi:hypothetical protein GRS48_04555 [Halorubrum sp. JWXQ-INN 858]|uniref:DUF7117 family protein n=1 Tax=Halorubrum sp. JWXQ-INN 858 TaxID=2690782 RepID=UPI00135CB483|nr:hypothetical protein [Halorubrum sp. JWXQ-INN 858]MWV64098.1 hypothetical protein [Halorubrum sp. JWXQ-INN 858]
MKVRGERECRDCGARWSYYGTGSVACPDCDSLRSVGVGGRTTHTDAPVDLDLTAHRTRFGEARGTLPSGGVDELKRDLRAYVRKRGFVRGGELRPLDATYLAARELLEAVDAYDRLRDPTDPDREYLLALLAGAEAGDRPAPGDVPTALYGARGLAAAQSVSAYREDLLTFLEELSSDEDRGDHDDRDDRGNRDDRDDRSVTVEGDDPHSRIDPARELLERLRDRTNRVEALQGDVDPAVADALVDAADAVGEYVRTGDPEALDAAREGLAEAEL